MERPRSAVILAGGLGLRLRPYTQDNPKPMIQLDDKPIAGWQIQWLRAHHMERVIFTVGHRWEKIRDYFGNGRCFGILIEYPLNYA